MYLKHFNLHDTPFTLTPNTQYFCRLPGYQAALNVLLLHLRNGEGFIKVTGKVGSGKTLLCRLLLEQLKDPFVTAYIPNPDLESMMLRKNLAAELGINTDECNDPYKLLSAINEKLMTLHREGKKVVLVIDEAQALPAESLETLRLLTNLETEKAKLLQIVLFGQPELDKRLRQDSLRQLHQRIGFSCQLPLLRYSELLPYLQHRLAIAGYCGKRPLFSTSARRLLFRRSGGTPRLINILSHKAMMSAYGRGRRRVALCDVRQAVSDTESVIASQDWMVVGLGLLLAAFAALFLYYWKY
ncbi:MAG: hypothetical protein A3E84_00340 [Gammaproteobacteria bacterium RIFCSPHIGHO2_12_FULL_42_13]|nr:MAG: hypothetical protein A3E84_00340 [Gammaproteobacteria bacterium RIFCSPHIGHO2_12_FULL_42_13]